MTTLNYHHLRYFWVIAHERSLTRAAERLSVSQSALSIQLRQLEERLGQRLFERRNRRLELTEAGRLTLQYADTIFRTGEELVSTLKGGSQQERQIIRVGSVATLSRNFQIAWLKPLLKRADVELVLHSGSLAELLSQLAAHTLDVVLTNTAVPRDRATAWRVHKVGEQRVSLIGRPTRKKTPLKFPDDLRHSPVILPGIASSVRESFDALMAQAGVRPMILAEIDDMAMIRLVLRESPAALALIPPVVVRDEIAQHKLTERAKIPGLKETFYAVATQRRFANPLVSSLIGSAVSTQLPS